MRSRNLVVSALFAAVAIAACDHKDPTSPSSKGAVRGTGTDTSTNGGGNTNPPPPVTPPPDSGLGTPPGTPAPTYNGPVHLTVTVVAATRNSRQSGDTLDVSPVANATVEVLGILQLAQTTGTPTDSKGVATFNDVIGGAYVIRVTPPASSGLRTTSFTVTLSSASVNLPVTLFRPLPD